jgi:hypothetical protein
VNEKKKKKKHVTMNVDDIQPLNHDQVTEALKKLPDGMKEVTAAATGKISIAKLTKMWIV